MRASSRGDPPTEVNALYNGLANAMNTESEDTRRIGDCKWGVYLFYDDDGEPIYAGQTFESLRSRIGRHLTNQRTDAVAMSVLDPFEVAEVEVWPFWQWEGIGKGHRRFAHTKHKLDRAEYTVYCQALGGSEFHAILNEKPPTAIAVIGLPPSHRLPILDASIRGAREHPDIRLARRARTISNLARVISERRVEPGIRRTLWAQAQRLEALASPHFSPGAVMIAEDFGPVRVLATESIAGTTVEGARARTGPKDPRGRGQRSPQSARSSTSRSTS